MTVCFDCRVSNRKIYTRTCIDCGDTKEFTSKRSADSIRCKVCSAKHLAHDRRGVPHSAPKVSYWYFCSQCDKIQHKRTKQGGSHCQDCNRRRNRTTPSIYFDLKEMKMKVPMKYYRLCEWCPTDNNLLEVKQASQAGIRPCRSHKYEGQAEKKREIYRKSLATRKANNSYPSSYSKPTRAKAKPRQVSKEAIAKEVKLNREHKAKTKVVKLITQTKTDEDMLAEFLANNKPSVVADNSEAIPHYWSGIGLGTTSSAIGGKF